MNMLPRVLEAELMDNADEALAFDTLDHGELNRQFVDDLLARCPEPRDVLDVGTGTAQIPVVLCRRVDSCRVMAADLARAMLELARYNIEVAGLIGRIQLDRSDAKRMPYRDGMFDVVISNGTLHHFADPTAVLAESLRVTCGGGLLFFRDLLRPNSSEAVDKLVSTYAGHEEEHARKMFDDSLRAAFSVEEIQAFVAALGFSSDSVYASSDRHWTWHATKP